MFKKILVAINCSSEASKIFNYALSLAQADESEILLVHFIDCNVRDLSSSIDRTFLNANVLPIKDPSLQSLLHEEVEIVNEWLHIFVEKAKKLNISCQSECHLGNCHSGISDRAQDWNADLVVMGHENSKTSSEIFPNSVSNYVIDRVPCPVLVVQEGKALKTDNLAIAGNVHSRLVKNST